MSVGEDYFSNGMVFQSNALLGIKTPSLVMRHRNVKNLIVSVYQIDKGSSVQLEYTKYNKDEASLKYHWILINPVNIL